MNQGFDKFRRPTSVRRFFSLFITVVWLTTLLQPCVMASVIDYGAADSHHSSDPVNHSSHSESSDLSAPVCPHCEYGVGDGCDPDINDVVCDGEESSQYISRIKPLSDDKHFKQSQPAAPGPEELGKTDLARFLVSFPGAFQYLPPGPSLRDLYRVYLK